MSKVILPERPPINMTIFNVSVVRRAQRLEHRPSPEPIGYKHSLTKVWALIRLGSNRHPFVDTGLTEGEAVRQKGLWLLWSSLSAVPGVSDAATPNLCWFQLKWERTR